MGGDYYEREVYVAPVASSNNNKSSSYSPPPKSYSEQASKALNQKGLHKSCDPKRFSDENKLTCSHKHPIVFALDVSGSMGDWPMIIYDKLPMFYGQIMMQEYLSDPSLSFCAVDDTKDKAPLQITDFGQGVQVDQLISKIYLERGGPGEEEYHELYELSAYFYLKQSQLNNVEIPYFFITGDEHFYSKIKPEILEKIMGIQLSDSKEVAYNKNSSSKNASNISSLEIWHQLKKKFNVFHLHKPYGKVIEKGELSDWIEALGEEWILEMKTPKACIDVILGVIALTSGARTMEGYVKDMEVRGQTKERIEEILFSLRHLTPEFLKKNVLRFEINEKQKKELPEKEKEGIIEEKGGVEEEKKEEK